MRSGLEWATTLLAQDGPQQTGPDFGKASPFGLIIVVLLLIATFLLVWSMNKHLRRLPKSFDNDTEEGARGGPVGGVDPDIATDSPAESTGNDSG